MDKHEMIERLFSNSGTWNMVFRIPSDLDILLSSPQSLEKWSSQPSPLDICLGEKTEYSSSKTEILSPHQLKMIGKDAVVLDDESTGHREGWTECFQDLETWCPPRQDELNAPQVTNTDCYNLGTIDQVRCLEDLYSADLIPETLPDDLAYMGQFSIGFDGNNNSYCNTTPPHMKLAQIGVTNADPSAHVTFSQPFKSTISTSSSIPLSKTYTEIAGPCEAMNVFSLDGRLPYDEDEDEDNFLSVPPDRVSRRRRDLGTLEAAAKKGKPQLGHLDLAPIPPSPSLMPSTPEVQNVLNDPTLGFDLIKYVVSADYVNVQCGSSGGLGLLSSAERDHDYSDHTVRPESAIAPPADHSLVIIKAEPLSPAAISSAPAESRKPRPDGSYDPRIMKRTAPSASDLVRDSGGCSSDGSEDWLPSSAVKRFKQIQSSSVKAAAVTVARAESDAESVDSLLAPDRYRELRDKNNEASRRSRLNRKQRDSEMKATADQLEMDNRALRAQATRMQKLVLDMREIILKTIKGTKT